MEQANSPSLPCEVSPSVANGTQIPSSSSGSMSGGASIGNSRPPPGSSIMPFRCLHSQILKVRKEDEQVVQAMERLPIKYSASRRRDACSSSSRRSRLGLHTGSQAFVQ
ncbi:hypothetical protein KP509_38G039300 [Ceratopteris richardii]|uniref:Uncharacterized protein n=1 Tax=Ceratopteris richardii TaxID=49495 RepID=A0A8T2Q447_CERRI|nr:hypothetical protein KP509_38G039300 [Ceratopteris richardii]